METITTTNTTGAISTDGITWYNPSDVLNTTISTFEQTKPKTITLAAHTRVNKPTLAAMTPAALVNKVKAKLTKQIFEQILASNLVTITSHTSPTGSVTFTATLEAVETTPNATA